MRRRKPMWKASDAEQKLRMRVLVRDDFRCQAHRLGLCDAPCGEVRLRHLHVHHIQMRSRGGADTLDNLITLCREHHMIIHPWLRRVYILRSRTLTYPVREL